MISAREFIEMKDKEYGGEWWSDNYEELAKVLEEYAILKILEELGKA